MNWLRSHYQAVLVWAILAALILAQLYLITQTFWVSADGSVHSSIEGYGDIPLHLTQISKFAFQPIFPSAIG